MTITDPKIYTEPFTVKHYWQRRPDIDVLEYYCGEKPRPDDEVNATRGRDEVTHESLPRSCRSRVAARIPAGSTPVLAHHSYAAFDRDKEVTLSGVVKEFQWNNPHAWIQIMVVDEKGAHERVGHRVRQPQHDGAHRVEAHARSRPATRSWPSSTR